MAIKEEEIDEKTSSGNSSIDVDDVELLKVEEAARETFLLSQKRHRCTLDNLNLYSIKSPQARAEEIQDFFKNELAYGLSQQEFILEMVQSHNKIRQENGLPELLLSPELSRVAQEYSEKLKTANSEELEHSDNVDFGENLAFYKTNKLSQPPQANRITEQWHTSRDNNGEQSYSATQIVWKNTELVGVGLAMDDVSGKCYVVCNYYPPGNVYDEIEKETEGADLIGKEQQQQNNNNNSEKKVKKKKKKRGCLGIC